MYGVDKNSAREDVIVAVRQNGFMLGGLDEAFQADEDIVRSAVMSYGRALGCASEELRNNKEIVMTAVMQDGWALVYASAALKNDKEVVMTAFAQNANMLEYAGNELKGNADFISDIELFSNIVAAYGGIAVSPNGMVELRVESEKIPSDVLLNILLLGSQNHEQQLNTVLTALVKPYMVIILARQMIAAVSKGLSGQIACEDGIVVRADMSMVQMLTVENYLKAFLRDQLLQLVPHIGAVKCKFIDQLRECHELKHDVASVLNANSNAPGLFAPPVLASLVNSLNDYNFISLLVGLRADNLAAFKEVVLTYSHNGNVL